MVIFSTRRHHAVIAGTGRAGTTFLVQFFAACGIETGDVTELDERANAGLEIPLNSPNAPYLAKDPWLYTYCDSLDLNELAIDVVILPLRDLHDAAASRLIQEKSRVIEGMSDHFAFSNEYGVVSGGSVYSLETLDLERQLAVGFYKVLHWAVANDLRVILADFPRLVDDRDYLLDSLWPWLGTLCTREVAEAAFDATADSSKVKAPVEGEQILSDLDFKAMQLVMRDTQKQLRLLRDENTTLTRQHAEMRLQVDKINRSWLWKTLKAIRRLLGA
jgi:hypothetical protein